MADLARHGIPVICSEYQRAVNQHRDMQFSQMEQQVEKNAAAISIILQKEQDEMVRRAFAPR